MSSIWTPSGERPVGRPEPDPSPADAPVAAPGGMDPAQMSEEELRAEMAEVQRQLVSTPAAVVVANHCVGLFQLAALHLEQRPPNLDEAKLAIDALAGIVESVGPRLGEDERSLRDALASIQMGFVQVKTAIEGGE